MAKVSLGRVYKGQMSLIFEIMKKVANGSFDDSFMMQIAYLL